MVLNPKDLGYSYVLGKRKGAERFEVCSFVGDWLVAESDGSKVCKKKDMTRWRYFREAKFLDLPGVIRKVGERVKVADEAGHEAWSYVIQVGETSVEGKTRLLVGL